MAEENNNPSPEELRRRIQERLQNLKSEDSGEGAKAKEEAPKKAEPIKEEPKNETPKPSSIKEEKKETPKPEAPKAKAEPAKPAPKKAEPAKKEPAKPVAKKEATKPTPKKEPVKKVTPAKNVATPASGEPAKKNNTLVVALFLLLFAAIGLFGWQYMKSSELADKNAEQAGQISSLNDEKSSIQSELENLLGDYKKLESSNEELNAQLEAERQKIEEYITQVKKLQGKAQKYDFYRRKLKELEKNKEKYIAQIDSLTTQNKMLTEENLTVKSDLEKTQGENEMLAGKVALASQIKGVNMRAEAVSSKGKPTTKAKKATELKICITLVENPVAKAGKKEVFIRIVEPNGSIMLTSKDNLFEANGEEIAYTASGSIDYKNAEITACIKHRVPEKSLAAGNYDLEVFVDGNLIGSRNIVLD